MRVAPAGASAMSWKQDDKRYGPTKLDSVTQMHAHSRKSCFEVLPQTFPNSAPHERLLLHESRKVETHRPLNPTCTDKMERLPTARLKHHPPLSLLCSLRV